MCAVSVIQDYWRNTTNPQDWTRSAWIDYQEILNRLAELDRKMGQPNCEDSTKAEWMQEVERRLAELERK